MCFAGCSGADGDINATLVPACAVVGGSVGDVTPTYGGVGIDLASEIPDRRELTVDVINAYRYYQSE